MVEIPHDFSYLIKAISKLEKGHRKIIINKGHIEESGTYNELIEKNGMFSDMYHGKLK